MLHLDYVLSPHRGPVTDIAFDERGKLFVNASADGTASIYELPVTHSEATEPRYIGRLCGCHSKGLNAVHVSGGKAITAGDDMAVVWDLATRQPVVLLEDHVSFVTSCHMRQNHALTGSADETCRFWDLTTGRAISILRGHQGPVMDCFLFLPEVTPACDVLAVSVSTDKSLKLWDPKLGRCVTTVNFDAPITNVELSPNAKFFLVSLMNQGTSLLRLHHEGGKFSLVPMRRFAQHASSKYMLRSCFVVVGSEQMVACGSDNDQLSLYDVKRKENNLLCSCGKTHVGAAVMAVAASPTRPVIAVGGSDSRIAVFTIMVDQ